MTELGGRQRSVELDTPQASVGRDPQKDPQLTEATARDNRQAGKPNVGVIRVQAVSVGDG